MAKKTPDVDPTEPVESTSVATADALTDKLAQVASAKRAAEAAKPVQTVAIRRPGLGTRKLDGRRSGGNFSLKRLVIASVDNISADAEPKVIDPSAARELCVPLHMEAQHYPTIQGHEVVMEEYEDQYQTEAARDACLARQVDPFAVDEDGHPRPRKLGFVNDPAMRGNKDPHAGKTWHGPSALQAPIHIGA